MKGGGSEVSEGEKDYGRYMPLLTSEKEGKVGQVFPSFIEGAPVGLCCKYPLKIARTRRQ